ncbi:MAG: DUF4367 domain-containing protein [Chloroflexi bacterium]|nr:DUF4367 domain-containing protein [Chloroflexota bacterium]MCC6894610.1 DUF4367 domain-containing protein [Anaerolineae bacterium]
MNHKDTVKAFNHDLDQFLTTGEMPTLPVVAQDEPLRVLADQLAHTDLSADSQRLPTIRQHLLETASTLQISRTQMRSSYPTWRGLRMVAIGLTALLIISAIVLAVPPLRTFAQDVLRQIGAITVSNNPTGFDVYSAQPTPPPNSTPIPNITPQVYEMRHLSVEQASALTGFRILIPAYLPPQYRSSSRDVWQRNGMNSVTVNYYNHKLDDGLSLYQTIYDLNNPLQTREFPVGDAPITDVRVRGYNGVWAEQVSTWPLGAGINMLIWQEGEFTFMMQSQKLPLAEMLKIAESLVPS